MHRSLAVHLLAFLYLCAVVSLILSCYREESVPVILRETARRTVKFVAGIALLSGVAYLMQRLLSD